MATRIFVGTLDGRLIAVDAVTGHACADFGDKGTVDLTRGVNYHHEGDYQETSPPTVVNNVVIVGSSIADNVSVHMEKGTVRGFDARTGKLLWGWDPLPPTPTAERRTPGRSSLPTRPATWCSCPPAAPAPTTMAACAWAMTAMPIP